MATHTHDEPHVTPPIVYLAVFLALIVGTILTVWVAYHDFGVWNKPIALAIAIVKTTLVVLYFMHVRHSGRLTVAVIAASVVMLATLMTFTASDYLTRGSKRVFYVEDPPPAGGNAARPAARTP